MSALSRRTFLSGRWKTSTEAAPRWVPVARLAELVPGSLVRVRRADLFLDVSSSALGVRALLESGRGVALRLAKDGAVEANLELEWPANRMLSFMTGEPIEVRNEVPMDKGVIHD